MAVEHKKSETVIDWRKTVQIVGLALLIRFLLLALVWNHPEHCVANDTESYTSIAVNLLQGHGFSSCLQAPYWPDIRRTPVYPLFLSSIMAFWGQNWIAIAIAQVLLDVLTCFLVTRFTSNTFGKRAGLWAGFFYATSVSSAAFSVKVLSETLCVFLLVCSFISFQKPSNFEKRRRFNVLLSPALPAFFWSLAVLCKPVVVVTAPCYLWWWWRQTGKWQAFVPVMLIVIIPLALWTARNARISGQYTLSCVAAINRLQYDAAGLVASLKGESVLTTRAQLIRVTHERAGAATNACSNDYRWMPMYRYTGDSIIKSHALRYTVLHVRGALNGLIPAVNVLMEYNGVQTQGGNTLALLQKEGLKAAIRHFFAGKTGWFWLTLCIGVYHCFFLGAAAAGCIQWIRSKQWEDLLCWSGCALLLILAPGMAAEPRMIMPALPFLAVMVGRGWGGQPNQRINI